MSFDLTGFHIPDNISFEEETLTDTYGKLIAEPLERGYGTTIGNSLRRIMLSSIEGAAISQVKIPGVLHEFSTIEGVSEDMVDVILNLKKIRFKMHGDGKRVARIDVKGARDVTGADIKCEANLEVLTPELPIVTVDKDVEFHAELFVTTGTGYITSDGNKDEDQSLDVVSIDSLFNPVKKVNLQVEKARVGKATDYDRLILEVWTDGSITPKNAVSMASDILSQHVALFMFNDADKADDKFDEGTAAQYDVDDGDFNENLLRPVEELELTVRSYNCLKNANIETIGDLVQKSESEMLKTKNFGRKSLVEIKEIMENMGLSFDMKVDPEALEKHRQPEAK